MKAVKQVVAVLVWCVVSVGLFNSAFAEYKAVTKFPKCQLVGGSRGCVGVTDPRSLEEMTHLGVDDVDIQACQVITDNINEMEKYNVDWFCDFPISSNNYLLSKPQWMEATGDKKTEALKLWYKTKPNITPKTEDSRPIYFYPFNLDADADMENIYMISNVFSDHTCDTKRLSNRNTHWFHDLRRGESNMDMLMYSSRIYLIGYSFDQRGGHGNDFYLRKINSGTTDQTIVCGINYSESKEK